MIKSYWVSCFCILDHTMLSIYFFFLFSYSGHVKKKKQSDGARLIISATAGIIVGYLIGINFPYVALTKVEFKVVNSQRSDRYQRRSLRFPTGGSKTYIPKYFYKTRGSKTYIPKNFYTKTTYSPLLNAKFGGSAAPSRPYYPMP
ncbi:hypothetical protein HanPI659440_Chr00c06g0716351 [Helianthus annuus]|nr:hypothetical protein HanPI659440_Chr00c06g0716351 [Helianthus annuus]